MQNTNAYVASEEREEIANEGKAAQQLEQILASGLPPLYRRAYRILGNATDAEDAVQDALLALFSLPIRPLLAARIVVFLARLWRRRSLAHAAILAVATLFFCALRPVSRCKAALRVATAFDSPQLTNKSSRLREWLRQ